MVNWVGDLTIKVTDAMPVDGLSGFIVRYHPDAHSLKHNYSIVLAEHLDGVTDFMERFVAIKEMMHCYFSSDDGSATDSQIILDIHMRQFFGKSATSQSLHVQAEYTALWMAMGVLCPEARREEYRLQLVAKECTIEEISKQIKAPTHIVQQLLSDQFEDELRDILN